MDKSNQNHNVKKYVTDPNKSWQEQYEALEKHHIEETSYLLNKIRQLKEKLAEMEEI